MNPKPISTVSVKLTAKERRAQKAEAAKDRQQRRQQNPAENQDLPIQTDAQRIDQLKAEIYQWSTEFDDWFRKNRLSLAYQSKTDLEKGDRICPCGDGRVHDFKALFSGPNSVVINEKLQNYRHSICQLEGQIKAISRTEYSKICNLRVDQISKKQQLDQLDPRISPAARKIAEQKLGIVYEDDSSSDDSFDFQNFES